MRIKGIQKVVYGVSDIDLCRRFWTEFGLELVRDEAGHVSFQTPEHAEVALRLLDDPALPPAPVAGPTVREVTWAVEDQASLDAIALELARDRQVVRGPDGAVYSTDPSGHAIGFELSRLQPVRMPETVFNAPGHMNRIDAPAVQYKKAAPVHLAHVVFAVQNLEEAAEFYEKRLGFRVTDTYTGSGVFLRGATSDDHHNLFLLRRGDARGFHHIAFDVRDIHEVFGGGLYLASQGWQTHIGPGRHPVSSAYFWYFKNPCGGAAEYDFDSDIATDAWQKREFEATPEAFAEWAYPDGAQRYTGMQTGRA